MKKRFLTLILSLTAMLMCIFGLTACGGNNENGNDDNPPHIHEFTTLKYDTTNHWFECECGDKTKISNHVFNNGADCACGYKSPHTHNYYVLKSNSSSHWYECSCGAKQNETPHNYSTLKNDSSNHWLECDCGDKKDIETHKGGLATETSKAVCSVCNQSYGTLIGHTHNYQATITPPKCEEKGYTTYSCECGDSYISDYVSALTHVYTNYSYNNDAKCEVDGTKTASCDNGCGTKNTINATGTALRHSFTRYYSDKNATYDKDGTKTANCDNGCGKKDTIADVGSMLVENEIRFNTLSVDGTDVYGKVSNTTETFSFIDEVLAVGTAKFVVSLDIYGMQPVATKTIPLTVGDNKVYVIEMIDGEPTNVYEVVVRRKPMYTVSFNSNGGTNVQSQTIEEDGVAIAPVTTRTGYTFDKWDYNFNTPITSNKTITASWTANTNTAYKVEYYLENLENEEYTLTQTNNLTGVTDTTAYAEIKTFEHFTAEKQTVSGNINGNGTTVLKVYYQRNEYTVSNADKSLGSITGAGKYKYGKQVTLQSSPILGYNVNWYNGETLLSDSLCYTVTIDKDITAKFTIKPEMANFNFTSTATTCVISGVKNKTITEITVPNYVTSIGYEALAYCKSLTSITLPFVGASLNGTSNMHFGYIFGASSYSYNDDYIPTSLKKVTITGGNILRRAFYNCSSLTSIEIPNSVTSIGDYAFAYCDNLTSVTIGNSVTSIGDGAFYYCDSLTSVVIPDSVISIGEQAFYSCNSLTSVVIGDSVTSIGNSAFSSCDSLTSIEIPNSVTSIGAWAFCDCDSLTSIEIPNSVTSIGDYAFCDCDSLTSIEIQNSVISIGDRAFWNCSFESVEIPNSVTSIGENAFCCDSLTKVNYLGTIDEWVQIEFNNSVSNPLYYAKNLYINNELVTEANITTATKINAYAFYNCYSLTSVVIPNSVKSIGEQAFYSCISLTIYCEATSKPSNWSSSWNYSNCPVIWNCNNNEVANDGYIYTVVDGIRYGLKDGVAKIVRQSRNITIASIPIKVTYKGTNYTVTSIGDYAFDDCDSLTSIEIPNSVTSIGEDAFYDCDSLTSIEIPNSVKSIGYRAFYDCNSLTSVVIGDSVTSIGYYAFSNCDSLTSVVIGDSVKSIDDYAFYYCKSLTSVTIGDSVTSIGNYAFYNCNSLTSINYCGSQAQWSAITKGIDWNYKTGNYTITYNYTGE